MTENRWALSLIGFLFLAFAAIAGFNYWMDPYMTFTHSHSLNNKQSSHTEFYAKVYHLLKNPGRYRQVVVGGSSAAHINVSEDTFNFGVSGFTLADAALTLEFLGKNQPQLQKIFLGAEGFQYMLRHTRLDGDVTIFDHVADPLYRYKNLLQLTTLQYSITNFLNNFRPVSGYYYDRQFKVYIDRQPMVRYSTGLFNRHDVNSEYEHYLQQIKKNNIPVVFYTSPMSEERLRLWHQYRYDDYENWLRTLVKYAGSVEHFAYLNEITKTAADNFTSDTHFYEPVGKLIFERLTGGPSNGFGVTLTPSNLEAELKRERDLLN